MLTALFAVVLHVSATRVEPILAVTAAVPMLLVLGIVVAVVSLFAWRGKGLAIFGVLTVVAVGLGGWTQLPQYTSGPAVDGDAIRVMTSNILIGQGDVDEVAQVAHDSSIDVLAIEELTAEAVDRIDRSSIAQDLPYRFVVPGAGPTGTGLFSRYPLRDQQDLPGFALHALSAVTTVPGHGDVQLFALHPVTPQTPERWATELEQIRAHLTAVTADRPVIALGDYNSTNDHAQFRALQTDGFRDAGELAGAGWLPTFPTDKRWGPVVGIDHVLVRGLRANDVRSHTISNSDHRAVTAVLG